MFVNAKNLAFPAGAFDIVLTGFVGWYDCFDFTLGEFTQPDTKAGEIWRVLRDGGRFVCCSWENQADLRWMEEAILRHYPAMLEDSKYLERRPIGTAYENPDGYRIILPGVGFREIGVRRETMTFVSTDEEAWWRQMINLGWDSLIRKVENAGADRLHRLKDAVFADLQRHKQAGGIHFDKTVFFVIAVK